VRKIKKRRKHVLDDEFINDIRQELLFIPALEAIGYTNYIYQPLYLGTKNHTHTIIFDMVHIYSLLLFIHIDVF
jgi:hypothetical protein